MVPNNIQFNYLHRDSGNYKLFGSIIFSNEKNLSIEEVEKGIRKYLIDDQFFYPKNWNIDLLDSSHSFDFFYDWYEFESIEFSNEQTNNINGDISELLFRLKKVGDDKYSFN